jgi:CheY-like chemotaxis protein
LLVVDDEPDILDLVVRRMVQAGHEVLAAGSGALALTLTERHGAPDAVVLDIDMPGMDGFALLEQLRQRRPGLPALFLSVLCGGEIHPRLRDTGAAYLSKPFSAADLRLGVQRLLGGGATAPRCP